MDKPLFIALASLLLPGAGHIALGQWRPGIALAALRLIVPMLGVALLIGTPSPASAIFYLTGLWMVMLGSAAHAVWWMRTHDRPATAPPPRVVFAAMLVMFLAGLGTSVVVRTSVAQAFRVPGGGMSPTLLPGDYIIADLRASSRSLERGDVVVLRLPNANGQVSVKRVVALGGDKIELRDRVLFRDGVPVAEPYAHHDPTPVEPGSASPRDNLSSSRVPPNHVFVLGDQRENSNDSRYFGPVPENEVLGRVVGTYGSLAPGIRWERIGRTMRELEAR